MDEAHAAQSPYAGAEQLGPGARGLDDRMNRRAFLNRSTAVLAGALAVLPDQAAAASPAAGLDAEREQELKKAWLFDLLPVSLPIADRFKLAADVGFEGIEASTVTDPAVVEEMQAGAERAGLRIHSVMNKGHWEYPLTSDDPEIVRKSHESLRQSLENAKAFGADTVLLVPGIVNPDTRYQQVWERSQREIRKVLPLARELGVTIAIENVGNRFLLSPLEFVRYVDEFQDPFLQAYFDIGNCLYLWGYPQDWILTLGPRIRKFHLKDCDFGQRRFVRLRDGDVDWPAVRESIRRIGFSGYLTVETNYRSPEIEQGDVAYLKDISNRIDLIFAGR